MVKNRDVRVMLNVFCYYTLHSIITPYFQLFLSEKEISHTYIGLLLGVWSLCGIAGPLLVGHYADKTGKFRTLMLLCAIFGQLILYPIDKYNSLAILLLFSGLYGTLFSSLVPITDSYISHIVIQNKNGYGRIRSLGSLGFISSMIILRYTQIFNDFSSEVFLKVSFSITCMYVLTIWLLPAYKNESYAITSQNSFNLSFKAYKSFWLLIFIVFMGRVGMSSYYSFFSIFLTSGLGIQDISPYWMIAVIAEIAPVAMGGQWIAKKGILTGLLISLLAIILRLISYGLIQSPIIIGFVQLLHGLTFGIFHITCILFINGNIPNRLKTQAISMYIAIGWGLSAFIGSFLGGLLLDRSSFRILFLIASLFPVFALLILLKNRKYFRQ